MIEIHSKNTGGGSVFNGCRSMTVADEYGVNTALVESKNVERRCMRIMENGEGVRVKIMIRRIRINYESYYINSTKSIKTQRTKK